VSYLTYLDIHSLTPQEYRAVLNHLGVESKPAPGIYFHVASRTQEGIRVMELWDQRAGFEAFVQNDLGPAGKAVGVEHQTDVMIQPLFNLFAPRLDEIPTLHRRSGSVVTTLDVKGLTAKEFRAILDRMGVEENPEPGIFLHCTTPTDTGYRIVELWDAQQNFEAFMARRLSPATQALGINRETAVSFHALHNVFAPRLRELPGLVASLPGGPQSGRSS
jgi:hypothetical protein